MISPASVVRLLRSGCTSDSTIAMLSGGLFLATAQSPVLSILVGMNMHGRIGLGALVVAGLTLTFGYAAASIVGRSTFMAAAVIGTGVALSYGMALPSSVKKRIRKRAWRSTAGDDPERTTP